MALIRDAVAGDAAAACTVLRRSISELCTADHRGDPGILGRWLANKTPQTVAGWIARPDNSVLVAIEGDALVAVGAADDEGHIRLNYVSPAARFRGVSRALLAALEARALSGGNAGITLESTGTARRFYLSAGYGETGPPIDLFGSVSYPMIKRLRLG